MSSAKIVNPKLLRKVQNLLDKGKLTTAIELCEAALSKEATTKYHAAIGRTWIAQVDEVAHWLTSSYKRAARSISVRSLYVEMNRFDINHDLWYLDVFAYDIFGGSADLDWLAGWKKSSQLQKRFKLRGTEDLQTLFSNDDRDDLPTSSRNLLELVFLILSLRMQELICAAMSKARQSRQLPDELPVLAAVHDFDLVYCSYGETLPLVTEYEPEYPTAIPDASCDKDLAVYRIGGGYDTFHNSLPWDLLDYANKEEAKECQDRLEKNLRLSDAWIPPRVTLRKRKWRNDIIQLYPDWAVNEKARTVLLPLLKKSVEFLPLICDQHPNLWLLHPLRHIDLSARAVHNGNPGFNITQVMSYDFEPKSLRGKHLFGIKQAKGSPARKAGYCLSADYVSEQFKQLVESHDLRGLVFEKVFSCPAPS